jgi:O-methyltransferase
MLNGFKDRLLNSLPIVGTYSRTISRLSRELSQERTAAAAIEESIRSELRDSFATIRALESERAKALGALEAANAGISARPEVISADVSGVGVRQEEDLQALKGGSPNLAPCHHAADLYLDLLESALTGVLYEDTSIAPWIFGAFDPAVRAIGRDWPRTAKTMIGTARMRNLRMLTLRAIHENVVGDIIETGVWRGGACIYMKGILAALGDRERKLFLADSFKGLPPPSEDLYPADKNDPHFTFQELAVSRAEVEANFQQFGLLDDRVVFLEGWFKDTLPSAPIDKLAVLRLDGDMYESTIDALNALYHKVTPGGFVIIDDYILKACAQAVDDFRTEHGITAKMNDVDGAAVWWQVPRPNC